MKLSLVVLTEGPQQGKVLEIKLSQFIIGRDPECHLRPASSLISKRHCALIQREGKAILRDFGSTNGTFLNEEPVKGEVELQQDDQLRIGPLEFLVNLEETEHIDQPAPTEKANEDKTVVEGSKTVAAKPAAKKPAAPAKPAAGTRPPGKAKLPAPSDATPAPTSATKSDSKEEAEEDIAAMLLSMGDDPSPSRSEGSSGVPEGDTLMEIKMGEKTGEAGADKPKEDDKAKKAADLKGNTVDAAKAILEKMMRRPRS